MTYKGYRIDKQNNVFDLGEKRIAENIESVEQAKKLIDEELERKHRISYTAAPGVPPAFR